MTYNYQDEGKCFGLLRYVTAVDFDDSLKQCQKTLSDDVTDTIEIPAFDGMTIFEHLHLSRELLTHFYLNNRECCF